MRTAVVLTILLIGSPSASAQINSPTPPVMSSSVPGASRGDAGASASVPTSTGVTGATRDGSAGSAVLASARKFALEGTKNNTVTAIANCMQLWDEATHITKREWAVTCRRIHGRIDNMKSARVRTVEVVSPGTSKSVRPNLAPAPVPTHKVAIQVNQNDKALMDLALNNAKNVVDFYKAKRETVAVEIVTYGPGLHMLRADTSPVKDRIGPMSLENSNIAFIACGNTQANQAKTEGKPVTLISEAKVMPSGVVRLMELQKQGYAYIRP